MKAEPPISPVVGLVVFVAVMRPQPPGATRGSSGTALSLPHKVVQALALQMPPLHVPDAHSEADVHALPSTPSKTAQEPAPLHSPFGHSFAQSLPARIGSQ